MALEKRNIIRDQADKYQRFFNFMLQEHKLTLTIREMDEIFHEADVFAAENNCIKEIHNAAVKMSGSCGKCGTNVILN